MFQPGSLGRSFRALAAIALLMAGVAAAQDRDAQEVTSYVLTDAGLAKYARATKNMAALPAQASNACDEEESSDSQSLDQVVAKFNATPGFRAAIQSGGMTTREYVVFFMSVFHNGMAAWALTQPGGQLPAGTSKANVDFYNKHATELEELGALQKDDECDAQSDEEVYEE